MKAILFYMSGDSMAVGMAIFHKERAIFIVPVRILAVLMSYHLLALVTPWWGRIPDQNHSI